MEARMNAQEETILSLRRNLGLTEEIALKQLNTKIEIHSTGNPNLQFLEEQLLFMLKKTFISVTLIPTTQPKAYIEVIVHSEEAPTSVFISCDNHEAKIDLTKSILKEFVVPERAFQLLISAYATGCIVVQSSPDKKISRGEKYPITLNWKKFFGDDLTFMTGTTFIEDQHLVGLGAIGSWATRTLENMNVSGKILGYDDDFVSSGNLQRTTFEESDVQKRKVDAIQEKFNPQNKDLKFTPISKRYDPTNELHKNIISCVDSRGARRMLQDAMPQVISDCSTTDISEVTIFFGKLSQDEACLSCLYSEIPSEEGQLKDIADALAVPLEEVKKGIITELYALKINQKYPEVNPRDIIGLAYDSFAKALCGRGALKPSDEKKLENVNIAPLCHVSAIAGIFMAIEIKRRFHHKEQSQNWNYWKINPWTTPSTKMRKRLTVNEKCTFHGTPLTLAQNLWKKKLVMPVKKIMDEEYIQQSFNRVLETNGSL